MPESPLPSASPLSFHVKAADPTMTSNTPISSTKTSINPIQVTSPAQVQPFSAQPDNYLRRSGGNGSFGGSSSIRPASSSRNNQSLRKHHKGRRPKLAAEDTMGEAAVIRSTSSRKGQTSITHLMNFTLPPRPQNQGSRPLARYQLHQRPTWGLGSGYHAVDKARYIHANYRFIVDPRYNYSYHASDPDMHLDWNSVLQILASGQSQATSCPICLSTPLAPRMAKCGHIFCLPCLIRYLYSAEDGQSIPEKKNRWKPCPICWDSIYMIEMRPVRWFQGQEAEPPCDGNDIVLRLMTRKPGNTLALPRDGAEHLSTNGEIPWYFAAEVADYARIMKGSEEYMLSSFDLEIDEIRLQEQEDHIMFGEEDHWTQKAISTIHDMKVKLEGMGNPPAPKPKPGAERSLANKDSESGHLIERSNDIDFPSSAMVQDVTFKAKEEQPFFFYQALLHYYLSPLDIRVLKAAFGSYSAFPATILPRVEHVSTGHIIDDELRRRAKYLGHLPYGCEVGFLECDWTDIVPERILEQFSTELSRRRKRNREKEAREEKARIRAEKEEEDKRWATARRKRPSLSKAKEDLLLGTEVSGNSSTSNTPLLGSSAVSSSPPWGSPQHTGSVFASLASPSTSPSTGRTVWGTAAVAQSSPTIMHIQHDDPMETDGWLQGWEQDLLLDEERFVEETKALKIGEASSSRVLPQNRKKKGKKITLMSTNARRAA